MTGRHLPDVDRERDPLVGPQIDHVITGTRAHRSVSFACRNFASSRRSMAASACSIAIRARSSSAIHYASLKIIGKLADVLRAEPAEFLKLPPKRRGRGR
jgi:hypothetical protein